MAISVSYFLVVTAASSLELMKPKTKDQFNEFSSQLVALIQKHEVRQETIDPKFSYDESRI